MEFIVSSLKEIKGDVKALENRQMKIREDIAGLKVQSGVWGAIGGCVPMVVALLLFVLSKTLKGSP
jgi:hypothetical protein